MIKILFNPFHLSEKKLLSLGIMALIVGAILGLLFNSRFDGAIDLHFAEKATVFQVFSDLLIAITTLVVTLYLIGLFINKKIRILDILIAVLVAKLPFYILPLFNIGNKMNEVSNKIIALSNPKSDFELLPNEILFLILSTIIALLAITWSVILLYNGFKTATNAKETKHSVLFVIGLLLSEIISKIIIHFLN
jgi:hypothetical protein